jgi:hypothetical protein
MAAADHCQLCLLMEQKYENAGRHCVKVTCERCGTFIWDSRVPRPATIGHQVRLSAFTRDQNAVGIVPFLSAELVKQIERMPFPRLRERSLRALAAMVQEVGYDPQNLYQFRDMPQVQGVSYCADAEELWGLMRILEHEGFVQLKGGGAALITPRGLLQAEELSQPGGVYLQGFVAMSFDHSMDDAYTLGFYPGIREAGYQPFRIDGKEHINGISDEILAEIRRSRFLVSDYTMMNNGVYFEAGVAVGLGIPVIATCRTDHFDTIHFDIKHINTLKWETPAQLATDLAKRVSAVIGDGPLRQQPNS